MYYGKGFGRYSFDHNKVYDSLPKHIERLLQSIKIDSAIMYNREYEHRSLKEYEALGLIVEERNKKWSKEKYVRI